MDLLLIGSAPAVWGFSLAGVRGQVVTTEAELNEALDQARESSDAGIVLITSDIVDLARDRISNLMARSEVPLIVEIPGPTGPSASRPPIHELLRRTIGVRL
ncbi:MAG: V-type ATP synthase subunit F [Anaerolineae bacterium]|nr:V-type ATP synthase subunit F [Anaerolineae bacterium]